MHLARKKTSAIDWRALSLEGREQWTSQTGRRGAYSKEWASGAQGWGEHFCLASFLFQGMAKVANLHAPQKRKISRAHGTLLWRLRLPLA